MARSVKGFSRPRRKTAWTVGPGGSTAQLNSASGNEFLGGALQVAEPVTIVRIRGAGMVLLNTTVAGVNEGYHGAIGIGICTEQAFLAGQASVPDPLNEFDWDGWMWHMFFDIHAVTSTLSDGVNASSASLRFTVDTKAMRKIDEGEILYAKMQTVENGTATMAAWFDTRALVKLN